MIASGPVPTTSGSIGLGATSSFSQVGASGKPGAVQSDPQGRSVGSSRTYYAKGNVMLAPVRKFVVYCWGFVFDHEVSPLRHIPDVAIRHYVLQALGLMWAAAFAVAAGSYTLLAISVIGHTVLIAAAAITVATWTAAAAKPDVFMRGASRKKNEGSNDPLNKQ